MPDALLFELLARRSKLEKMREDLSRRCTILYLLLG